MVERRRIADVGLRRPQTRCVPILPKLPRGVVETDPVAPDDRDAIAALQAPPGDGGPDAARSARHDDMPHGRPAALRRPS